MRTGMLVTADARAYGIVSGMRRGFNGRKPRTTGPASNCVSYMLDDNGNPVHARIFRAAPAERTHKPRTVVVTDHRSTRDILLQATMGTIHENL